MSKVLHFKLQENAANTTITATTGTSTTLAGGDNTSTLSQADGPGTLLPRSLLFNGTDDRIVLSGGDAAIIKNKSFISVMAWVKISAVSGTRSIFFSDNNSTFALRVHLFFSGTGAISCSARAGDAETTQTKVTSSEYDDGAWHHVAAVVDYANDAITIYVDGAAVTSTGTISFTATASSNTNFSTATIGGVTSGYFNGKMADLRVYDSNESANLAAIIAEANAVPPTITSATTYSIPEGITAVGQMTYTGDASTTWSITGGADSADFVLSSDGFLYFKQETNYSSPGDADTNNVYVVEITATNAGGSDVETLTITVTDVDRAGMLRPESATSATYTAHYDASHPTCYNGTPPANNAAVTTFYDRSGVSGVNLTNSGTVTFKTSQSTSGLPALSLVTSGAYLSGNVFTTPNWSQYTVIVVAKPLQDSSLSLLRAVTAGSNLINVGRNSGNPTTDRAEGRGSGYAVFSNTLNTANFSTGVPPGNGVIWINGNCYGSSNGSATIGTITATDALRIGGVFVTTQPDVAEVIVFRGALSVVETAGIHQHLMNKWGITAHEKFAFVAVGSSLTTGETGTTSHWPTSAALTLYDDNARDVEFYNLAQTSGTSTTLSNQSTMFDDLRTWLTSRGVDAVFIMWHGHNNSSWSASVQSDIETYPAAWRSAGHRALSITISPRGTSAPDVNATNYAANHAWHNASAAPTYVDAIVDTTELPWMADINAWVADTTNRSGDGLHLTAAGYTAFGEFMAPKILEQIEAFAATGGNSYTSPGVGPFFSPAFSPLNPIISIAGG